MNKVTPQLRAKIVKFAAEHPGLSARDIAAACDCRPVDVRQVFARDSEECVGRRVAKQLMSDVPGEWFGNEMGWRRLVMANFGDYFG